MKDTQPSPKVSKLISNGNEVRVIKFKIIEPNSQYEFKSFHTYISFHNLLDQTHP